MSRCRLLAVLLGLLSVLGGCSRGTDPPARAAAAAPAAAVPGTTSSAAAAAPPALPASASSGPQLTQSPDLVHIQYQVYGRGDPAVVLIHGWACSSAYWRAQLAPLQAHYTVVTLDLAGHGGSDRNRTDWSIANFGADVTAVVKQLPNRRIVLVGHSMGGPVALAAASELGARVIGVIGVDTFTSIGLPPPTAREVSARLKPFRSDFMGSVRDLVSRVLFTPDANPQLVRMVADDMSRAPPDIALASLVALNTVDFSSLLATIHVPIIAIDSAAEQIDEARIRKAAPTFQAVTVPGTSHFLMLQDPQQFNPVLLRELAALSAPATSLSASSARGG
jgi:pimeloyl-ACP methyl ester carboxylesterase